MNSFDEERKEYKDKVGRQNEAIASLLDLAEKHTGLFDFAMLKNLRIYQDRCAKLYRKLDKNEFEVAIVGLEKAGKSTFGNALMEDRILPDADERCTYTSTCIRYGNDRAVVQFFSAYEMDEVLRGYLDTLGVENTDSYTYQGLSRSEYQRLFQNLDPRDQSRYENTVHQDILNLLENKDEIRSRYIGQKPLIFQGDDLYQDEFKSYIINPKVAVAVKDVSMESSKLENLQNAVIYDVPGFDSPTSMHLEQTKQRMKEADAIMLIASAEKPDFTAPALNMFQEVVDEDNVSLSDKLFIFGNRADGATTLAKNIQRLKDEAERWKLLKRGLFEDRIMVGSAKAHLEICGILSSDSCRRKVEEDKEYKLAWPHGDGIKYAYEKLIAYNENERFEIVKKKVRKNNEELKQIFQELKEKYSGAGSSVDLSKLLKRTTDLKNESKKELQEALEKKRQEIRIAYNQELVLSKRLQEEIRKLYENHENYIIHDKDIEYAQLKIDDVSGSVNVEKAEEIIREEKFNLIYDDFSKAAFMVAQNDHEKYYQEIVESFENALHINKKAANYDTLHEAVTKFVEKYKKSNEDEFIYQSVIERFVRDVVEILIRRPYSSEARLNKFVDEAEIFSGLVMFYNHGDANEGYKKQFLSVAPKNQPLLLALVFHNYKSVDESSKSAMDYIGSICKSLCDNPEVVQLVFSIVKQDPIGGIDAIHKMVTKDKCKNCKTEDDYVKNVVPELRSVRNMLSSEGVKEKNNSIKKYDFDFTNKAIFEKQYKQFFGEMPVRTYDDVRKFFQTDLYILEKFLIHASIPAIRLEKPFVAREVQSINRALSETQ